jgi:phosphoribosyl 1,2-cyclic phosphodiesterase
MSIELCVLGSGSAGNSSLLRINGSPILIDAGFGPRAIRKRLAGTGVDPGDLRAVLLTHLDRDHFKPTWLPNLLQHRIPLYLAERHLRALYHGDPARTHLARQLHHAGLLRTFKGQPFQLDHDLPATAQPIHLAHDQTGTVGYLLRNGEHRLGYATDLGRVPPALLDAFTDVDLLAIESNYDRDMELASDRPAMLKRRVTGGRGHLSNDEAQAAIRRIFDRSTRPPRHVVLLHLSRQCNCPRLVRRLYAKDPAVAGRLCLTSQHARTQWLRLDTPGPVIVGEQLPMFT